MKRFRFSLRPLAVLRAYRELRAREAFAASVHAFENSEDTLTAARAHTAQFEATLCAGRLERFSAADEGHALAAYRRECHNEGEAERAMNAAHAAMQQRRVEYLAAHRDVEVVARLEVKSREAHRLAAARAEQAGFDEFARRRFAERRSLFPL